MLSPRLIQTLETQNFRGDSFGPGIVYFFGPSRASRAPSSDGRAGAVHAVRPERASAGRVVAPLSPGSSGRRAARRVFRSGGKPQANVSLVSSRGVAPRPRMKGVVTRALATLPLSSLFFALGFFPRFGFLAIASA